MGKIAFVKRTSKKKYPKTEAKILSISPLSVFSASGVVACGKPSGLVQSLIGETPCSRAASPLRVYVYSDNLFLGNPKCSFKEYPHLRKLYLNPDNH